MQNRGAQLTFHGTASIPRGELRAAAQWMLATLLSKRPRLLRTISATLTFSKRLHKEGIVGECMWTDSPYRPRAFDIRIDPRQSKYQLLLTLAHELIHLKQYVTGELFEFAVPYNKNRWRGKIIFEHDSNETEMPWEREAWSKQALLVKAYRKFQKTA